MLSVYSVYFNNEADVVILGPCENYSDAEKNFEKTTQNFVKYYYQGAEGVSHPVKIQKYEEGVNSTVLLASAALKSDPTFPSGLLFVKKKFEACIYEKVCHPGTVYNSYTVKYLGRIGVIMQDLPGHTEIMQRLKDVSDLQESKIRKLEEEIKRQEYTNAQKSKDVSDLQESKIRKLEEEVKRLEYTNAILEKSAREILSGEQTKTLHKAIPMKPNEITRRKEEFKPEIAAIKDLMASGRLFGNAKFKVKRIEKGLPQPTSVESEIDQILKDIDALTIR